MTEHKIMETLSLVLGIDTMTDWTEDRLSSLAATYDHATCPVWILDANGRCVYQNARAHRALREGRPLLQFEITDQTGNVIGQLTTLPD